MLTESELIGDGFIPYDKSWIIRMLVLDLVHNYEDGIGQLRRVDIFDLSDDIKYAIHCVAHWQEVEIEVGESATLFRFLQFLSWKEGLEKKFVLRRTLKDRNVCNNPAIVSLSQKELLQLDNSTSQWASAKVLLGDEERLEDCPFKLKLTYEAVEHWKQRRDENKCWEIRYDRTILKQAMSYLNWLETDKMDFTPEQPEDYCFARGFGCIEDSEWELKWPSLKGHESNRVEEMRRALEQMANNETVITHDHRVAQVCVMLGFEVDDETCIRKSWPQLTAFLKNFCDRARLGRRFT